MSDDGVRRLAPTAAEPEKAVVDLLEHLLASAKRGEIHGVAAAVVERAGVTTYAYAHGRRFQLSTLAGALLRLQHAVVAKMDRVAEGEE